MYHRITPPVLLRAITLLFIGFVATACKDSTGPDDSGLPGTLVLESPQFAAWTWLPNGQEILYSTPFDYPYTGPPTRLEAVGVSGADRRTVAAAPRNGDRIVSFRFEVQGSHVYFEMSYAPDKVALYRAPLSGASAPESVLDSIPYGVTVSPDERLVSWVNTEFPRSVITVEIASGARRVYPLPDHHGDRIVWSPSGRSMVVEFGGGWVATGTPFQWLDLESGTVQVWLAPSDQVTFESTRDFRWEGETPFLYTTGDGSVARYSLATGIRERLASAEGSAVGWSPDFETVVLATNRCLGSSSGPLGGDCIRWASSVDRLAWKSGQKSNVLRHEGSGPIIGRLSPIGTWFAYEYSGCGGGCYTAGDGLYIVPMR